MSQNVSHQEAAEALDSLDDYARMDVGVDAYGPRGMLERYIAQQAATLRQPAARVDVTDKMVSRAVIAAGDYEVAHKKRRMTIDEVQRFWKGQMRAALEAALSAQPAPERQGEDYLYVEARQCEDCDHLGINDCSDTNSACGDCEWQGPTPDEDQCPSCAHKNCMAVACPKCGGRYRFLADRRFTHPAAPVGVPDVHVDKQGVRFGDGCWYSHERITGVSADLLNEGKCSITAREYMKWVQKRLTAAPSAPQGTQQGVE